ncbi:MAG: helix-turn-helix transcriptional regulator [Clostridia bacterium]|nr:helix-turn-helix transcriptional regulator [Clostridia bacterium]
MQLNVGNKIRELRRRDGRTQEALAEALGVTSQAVSRWESGGSYPDMELMPPIANYFGVTIDELFGYHNDRERKIQAIMDQVDAFGYQTRSDDEWVDECLAILREGLAEFPQNERLLLALADALSEAGWRRYGERIYYDDEGYMQHDHERHKKNHLWAESVKICEYLVDHAEESETVTKAISILILQYRNIGEYEKAVSYAKRMPKMGACREHQLACGADGKEEAGYIGALLLETASLFAEQMVYGLITNRHHFESDLPIEKIKGVISVFDLICDDGNLGQYHGQLLELYLYLSRIQWERGYHDDAFTSLDEALRHAKAFEALLDGGEHSYTAPLVSFVKFHSGEPRAIAKYLPEDWPMWYHPDYSQVEQEIKSDPRWNRWVERTQA